MMAIGIALFAVHHAIIGSLCLLAAGSLLLGTWLSGPILSREECRPDDPEG
jgi:hypothetical protein